MSMVQCDNCGAPFDSDDDPGCFAEDTKRAFIIMCENCREDDED